jgi:hypothetical protein
MRRPLLRLWPATSVLAAVVTLGCQHARHSCPTCSAPAACVAAAPEAAAAPGVSSYAPTFAAPPLKEVPAVVVGLAARGEPTLSTAGEVPPVPDSIQPPAPEPEPPPAVLPTAHLAAAGPAVRPALEAPVARRTFTDITADPRFAHEPGYGWLVGTLDYSRVQKSWVLRYASVEEEDRYGGSVALVGPGDMNGFTSGQLVRVEGHLLDPESKQPRPPYRVRAVQPAGP